MASSLIIFIVYHSGFGHTEVQAKAVERGVSSVEGIEAIRLSVDEVDRYWDQLDAAHGIIFGCPTYMGSASAKFKDFMEKSGRAWGAQKWKDKIAAGFTTSGRLNGEKLNTLIQLFTLAAQHSMIWVPLGLLPGRTPEEPDRLGVSLGAMAQADVKDPVDKFPSAVDLQSAEHLGKTVALAAKRWYR